jgi:hypothetical protein
MSRLELHSPEKTSEGCFCAFPGEKWRDAMPTTRFFVLFVSQIFSWGTRARHLLFPFLSLFSGCVLSLDHTVKSRHSARIGGGFQGPSVRVRSTHCILYKRPTLLPEILSGDHTAGKLCRAIVGKSLTDSSLQLHSPPCDALILRGSCGRIFC